MRTGDFVHVGLTVSDMERTVQFYQKYFGFTEIRRSIFSEAFIGGKPMLYHQEPGVFSHFSFLQAPNGFVLELFQFSSNLPAEEPVWNRPGYHHICIMVDDIEKKYAEMSADGVYFYFPPAIKGDPANNKHWVFLRDPDGNMIELQD